MSDKNDLSHYIPKRLDDTGKFLFWDKDVAFIALAGVLLGLAIDFPIMGLLFGIVAAFYYGKLKGGKHPGMAIHILYWLTGFPELQELPNSHFREFNG